MIVVIAFQNTYKILSKYLQKTYKMSSTQFYEVITKMKKEKDLMQEIHLHFLSKQNKYLLRVIKAGWNVNKKFKKEIEDLKGWIEELDGWYGESN